MTPLAARLLPVLASLLLVQPGLCADGHGEAKPHEGEAAEDAKPNAPAATEAKDGTTEAAEGEAEGQALIPMWPETPAVEMERQPYILIRSLRSIQDRVALGDVRAHQAQRSRMQELTEQLRDMPVAVWDDVRNVRAAIYFVLSGGDPAVLKIVLGRPKTPFVERRLLKGALAYGEGRMVDALSQIHKLDARNVDVLLGGMLALVQGTLVAKKDPLKAIPYLDDARLLSPGTLIEEAALRQQILILAREGQLERFDQLTAQYTRRFPNSIFARNFRRQFFAGVARKSFKGADGWISRAETELEKMPAAERPGLYLAIADEALKVGNVNLSAFAAGKARELSQPGSRTVERAKVYEGAALAVSPEFQKGLDLLNSVDIAKVTASERQIRESALSVAQNVGKWPSSDGAPADEPPLDSIGRAQAMLTEVDSLLGGSTQ
jgi:chemotaxis protein MotC